MRGIDYLSIPDDMIITTGTNSFEFEVTVIEDNIVENKSILLLNSKRTFVISTLLYYTFLIIKLKIS
ncbi:MAG: hypothetical protein R2771_01290 [Saprospiraceae bacterium]